MSTSFDKTIAPLFRDMDIACMGARGLDLSDWWQNREHAETIYSSVATGRMPIDDPWPEDRVNIYRNWVDSGATKFSKETYADFFRDLDAHTEYWREYMPDSNGRWMKSAVNVMGTMDLWGEYAQFSYLEDGDDYFEDLVEYVSNNSQLKDDIRVVDELLVGLARKHFSIDGVFDGFAFIDAFEHFGLGSLPQDPNRDEIHIVGNHPEGEAIEHRMDSTSMWFFWAMQVELSFLIATDTDEDHEIRTHYIAALCTGAPMDFVFRNDSAREEQNRKTKPSYTATEGTRKRIRSKSKRIRNDWSKAIKELHTLFQYFRGTRSQVEQGGADQPLTRWIV